MTMQISERGLDLVAHFEGFRAEPYMCPGNVLTAGFGTTDPSRVYRGMKPITRETGLEWLRQDLATAEQAVRDLVTVPLTQGQHDALTSFTHNLGRGALARSTLLKKLNAGQYGAVDAELQKWVYAGGKKLKGLVRRRRAEADLFDDFAPDLSELDTNREVDAASRGAVESVGGEVKPPVKSRTIWGGIVAGAAAVAPVVEQVRATVEGQADNIAAVGWGQYVPLVIGGLGLAGAALVIVARLDDQKKA